MTTADRILGRGWWPTKGMEARAQYVGPDTCCCHKQVLDTQKTTAMAHASTPGKADESDASRPLKFQIRMYSYAIAQTPAGPSYSADDGIRSLSTPLDWVFGSGHFGQTYVYQQNGTLYESQLSYFSRIQSLDFTTGHLRSAPPNLEKALGVPNRLTRFVAVSDAIPLLPPPTAVLTQAGLSQGLLVKPAMAQEPSTSRQ